MPMPKAGEPAPPLRLPSSTGEIVDLASLVGRSVVVFFYPKAATPGCTVEACGFRDLHGALRDAGAEVLGVSADPPATLAKWARKKEFPYALLGDEDHATLDAWGVWGEKSFMGRRFMGVSRATFLVGPDGRIARVWAKVNPIGHARDVLDAVLAARGG